MAQVKWWADATIDELVKKGAVKIKKLYKKLVNVADEQNQELLNPNDKDDAYNKFLDIIENLKKESKIIDKDGTLSVNKLVVTGNHSNNKRKRSDSADSTSQQTKVSKPNQGDENDQGDSVDKWEALYPEMYKNGERYWKEGTLSYEYLSTNPQK